jgi:DHA1 family multidrug resistance protein-like MFS transporter
VPGDLLASRAERANLWVIAAAQFLTLGGMTAVLPLLPLYLQHIGVTDPAALKYWTGALGSAPFLIAVFATPLWGAFADRVGHKPMVVRSVLGIALATVGMGFSGSPGGLLFWRAVQGAVSGVFPAAVALISALTPERRVSHSLAVLQSARAAGALCGPVAGGLLADLVGIRPLFFGVGALALLTAAACSYVIDEPETQAQARASRAESVRLGDLLRQRDTLGMLVMIVLFQVTVMCSWPSLALFVEKLGVARDAVATTTGMVVFAAGLPATLTATLWARCGRRFGVMRMLAASLTLTGFSSLAVGLAATRVAPLLGLRVFSGLSMAGFIPLSFEWINARASGSARGRAAGLASTAMMLGNVIGPLLGGWLAVNVSLAATFWVPGAGLAVVGLALAASLLRPGRPH